MTDPAQQDILAVLDSDHRGLLEALAVASAAPDDEARAAACEQLVMQTVRHLVAEEQYLLPLYVDSLDDGAALAHRTQHSNRAIEDSLRRLEDLETSEEAVRPILGDIHAALRTHIDEQRAEFAMLRERCSPERLAELGEETLGAEQLAPTRPRSVHPDSPALNKVVSLISGFVDRTRDAYTRRGVEDD